MRIKMILALFLSQLFPFLILLPNIYQLQHIRSLNEIYETWWIYSKDAHVSPFLYRPLIAGLCPFLMIYIIFLPFVLQNMWHLIHGFGIGKEVTTFSSSPPKGFSAELCPFEVLKRKKFVMATPPKLFDGIPWN